MVTDVSRKRKPNTTRKAVKSEHLIPPKQTKDSLDITTAYM